MSQHPDVLIIGGGVIGLSCAYCLARDGVAVTVVDKGDLGREASWAGAGILPPGNPARARGEVARLRAYGSAMHEALAKELRERTGIDNGYVRSGGLELLVSLGESSEQEWLEEEIAFERLDGAAVRRVEPALATGVNAGYFLPDMAQVRNPRHLKAMIAACASLGVILRPHCRVEKLISRNGKLHGVATSHGELSAGQFLLAAGAWTEELLQEMGIRLGIRPMRGQIVLLNTGTPLLHRIVLEGRRYLVPRQDGYVLVGSTEEDVGFDQQTTAQAIGELLQFAVTLVPALQRAAVERTWAGLRPGSPDELPFLGRVPGWENVLAAAGHFRAGIQLAPITGVLVKELILGQALTLPLESFRLGR